MSIREMLEFIVKNPDYRIGKMDIPTIGRAKGIFEIFVPGAFLLLNIAATGYYFHGFIDAEANKLIDISKTNSLVLSIVIICFGYLIGVLIRLLRADFLDDLSAAFLRIFRSKALLKEDKSYCEKYIGISKRIISKRARNKKGRFKLFVIEEFPYIGWLGEIYKDYPWPGISDFYNKVWKGRIQTGKHNKQFFNFIKVMAASEDNGAANEIYAAESLTRYIIEMFYALVFASILVLITIIFYGVFLKQFLVGLFFTFLLYFISILIIIYHFRFMRIKEVETVFTASFKNRSLFEEEIKTTH